MNKKYICLPMMGLFLAACTTTPNTDFTDSSLTNSTSESTTETTNSSEATDDISIDTTERLLMSADFSDAVANTAYNKGVEGWTLSVSPNSYAGAIKLQYAGNSLTSKEYSFHGPVRIELDWYATVNNQVVTTDPFLFSIYGLNAADEINETYQYDNVLDLPNPGSADHHKDTIILPNTNKLTRSVKFELTTKLASSNVGIISIDIYGY